MVKAITAVLDEYNIWKDTKMIIADTTNVKTGKWKGNAIQLQDYLKEIGRTTIKFELHVLGSVLRVIMDDELGAKKKHLA